jgi:hypothetical protein
LKGEIVEPLTLGELTAILKENEVKQADINAALALKEFIEKLDIAIFPKKPRRVLISPISSVSRCMACYVPRPSELYIVYAPELVRKVRRRIKSWSKRLSLSAVLTATAAHEVRHRVQERHKPKLFKPESKKPKPGDDDIVAEILKVVDLSLNQFRKRYKREGRSRNYVRLRAGRLEFDARVVETMVLYQLGEKHSLKKITPFIKVGMKSKTA